MTPRHQLSRAAIEIIKRFEGYRRKAGQLPDGRWTIGYGHTLTAREGAEISESDAEALLLYDLMGLAHTVSELVYADLTQNQFDALCAFTFSIGLDAFRGSDVLKRVNEGAFTQAAFALELWRKVEFEGERIVIDALVRRRAAEKLLFLTPVDGAWRPAPSAVLKPLLDETAVDTAPREAPVQVLACLEGDAVAVVREDRAAAEPESPVKAAAEAVTTRLQTLFADFAPEPANAPAPQPANEPEPASDPEPPLAALSEPPNLDAEAPPEPEVAKFSGEPAAMAQFVLVEPEPERAPEAGPEAAPEPSAPESAPAEEDPPPRIFIDDTAPFDFVPPLVQRIEPEAGDGVLAIVSLVVLGLAFFAGGVFWALSAQPPSPLLARPGIFTPLMVGWLAGVAGVGFIAAAVFMLLQRMTRAAERRDRRRI